MTGDDTVIRNQYSLHESPARIQSLLWKDRPSTPLSHRCVRQFSIVYLQDLPHLRCAVVFLGVSSRSRAGTPVSEFGLHDMMGCREAGCQQNIRFWCRWWL